MAKIQEAFDPRIDETEGIIEEYKQRIAAALEAERNKLKELAEKTSSQIIARASQESDSLLDTARQQAEQIVIATRNRADQESSKRLAEAQQKAEQIVREAEKRAEEKAKEKTKSEVQRITVKAREEAEKIIATARQAAMTESDRIIANSNEEAAQLLKAVQIQASAEAEKESERITGEARQKAGQITTDVVELGIRQVQQKLDRVVVKAKNQLERGSAQLLAELTQRIEKFIDEFELEMQGELESLVRDVAGVEKDLGQAMAIIGDRTAPGPEDMDGQTAGADEPINDAGATAAHGDEVEMKVTGDATDNKLYQGKLNLEISPPFDLVQLESLRESLFRIRDLQLLSTGGATDGDMVKLVYTVDLKRPLPLVKILEEMRPVESAIEQKKNIAITLKS